MPDIPKITCLDAVSTSYPGAVQAGFGNPPTLYLQGNLDLLDRASLGFCGSRKASRSGLETTYCLARNAAEKNIVVISGNAKGVDTAAHMSALENDGETILVLPEGIDRFRVRADLRPVWDWRRVLVISQFERNAPWQSWRAMQRNKLVISLSNAIVVVEAGEKGGTLDAGKTALRMGRPLLVAHYDPIPEAARGNSWLLEDGGEKVTADENIAHRMQPAQTVLQL